MEMKPCPFCTGTDIRIDAHLNAGRAGETVYSMCCYDCGATFPNRYKRQLLVAAWNRRSLPPSGGWRNAVLEEAAKKIEPHTGWGQPNANYDKGYRQCARTCLAIIRSLKQPLPEPPTPPDEAPKT